MGEAIEAARELQNQVDDINRECARIVMGIVKQDKSWEIGHTCLERALCLFNEKIAQMALEEKGVQRVLLEVLPLPKKTNDRQAK